MRGCHIQVSELHVNMRTRNQHLGLLFLTQTTQNFLYERPKNIWDLIVLWGINWQGKFFSKNWYFFADQFKPPKNLSISNFFRQLYKKFQMFKKKLPKCWILLLKSVCNAKLSNTAGSHWVTFWVRHVTLFWGRPLIKLWPGFLKVWWHAATF